MKYVEESLNKFQDEKFFSNLFEADKDGMDKQTNKSKEEKISPEEKKKLAVEFQKQGMAVVKKVNDNFNRFKAAAGDKMQSYKDFWAEQKTAEETVGKEGMFYNLYDSYYIVGVIKNAEGNAEMIVYNTDGKDTEDFETFVCKDKGVIKEFVKFYNGTLKATMKEVIANHKAAIAAKKAAEAAKKKEETAAAKRAKLDQFLKESESKKKQ
jgi:hypothetical protein